MSAQFDEIATSREHAAKGGSEIAMEELTLSYEGLQRAPVEEVIIAHEPLHRPHQASEVPTEEVSIVYHNITPDTPVSSDPEWKYVSVRRVADALEKDVKSGLDWVVFEGNDEPTWDVIPTHTPDWTDFNDGEPGAVDGGGSVIPGSDLMEVDEEDELQTLPADAVMGDGGLGPWGPGGPEEVSGEGGLGPVPEIGQVMGDNGVSPLPTPLNHNLVLKRGIVGEAEQQARLTTDADFNEGPASPIDEFVFLPATEDELGMFPMPETPTPGPVGPVPLPYPTPSLPSDDSSDPAIVEEIDALLFV